MTAPMNPAGKLGLALTALLALLGAWVLFSPFMTGHQAPDAVWTAATRADVWTGAALLAASAFGLLGIGVAYLAELERAARNRPPLPEEPDSLTA